MTVTKYSANGNDFVIFHAQEEKDRSELARKLCHRQNGIGADGLVVLLPHNKYDFKWEFYNSDGSLANMCGNASRAVAHYAHEKGISKNNISTFLTGAGVIRASINGLYIISDMTTPTIYNQNIKEFNNYWWLIDSGVPHLVSFRDSVDDFDILQIRELRYKYNANINIYTINNNKLFVRTYERGVEGETLACGTGMVACYIKAHKEELVPNMIAVFPKSQDELYVSYEDGIYRFGGQVTKTFIAETLI
ncbi:MAG: diaminopimelate epimerase [Sulfurovum sp.]|nr:diaminopimelate epimerase [Sulfurovaceae bacterium]